MANLTNMRGSPPEKKSVRALVFGDSLYDLGGGNGSIGNAIHLFTSYNAIVTELATGGHDFSQIRTTFDANWPPSDPLINTVILGGIHNDLNGGRLLADIMADVAYIADTVIAYGGVDLLLCNGTPYMDNTSYTSAHQAVLDGYNAWVDATYPDSVVDLYSALGDPAEPRQLAPEFYKIARGDVNGAHTNDCGDRRADQELGESLITLAPYDLTEPAGNLLPNYRDLINWTPSGGYVTAGGNSIKLADGSYASDTGMISTNAGVVTHEYQASTALLPANALLKLTAIIRPGNVDRCFIRLYDGDNVQKSYQAFFVLSTLSIGTISGTGAADQTWEIKKAAHGAVEITLRTTNAAVVTKGCNVTVRSVSTGETSSYASESINRVPEIYIQAVSLIDIT